MSKTLIVYETYFGSTKKAAQVISDILEKDHQHEVEIYNIGKDQDCPDLDKYDNVIVGSCIYNGQWARHADDFLKNSFDGKKVALYVCSMFAGEPKLYSQAYTQYLEDKLEYHPHIKPISMEAFGGKVPKTEYPQQWVNHVANQLSEFTTDNRDESKMKEWAQKLGKMM